MHVPLLPQPHAAHFQVTTTVLLRSTYSVFPNTHVDVTGVVFLFGPIDGMVVRSVYVVVHAIQSIQGKGLGLSISLVCQWMSCG